MVKIKTQVQLNKKKFKTSITALIEIIRWCLSNCTLSLKAKYATCLCIIVLHNTCEVWAFHIEGSHQKKHLFFTIRVKNEKFCYPPPSYPNFTTISATFWPQKLTFLWFWRVIVYGGWPVFISFFNVFLNTFFLDPQAFKSWHIA